MLHTDIKIITHKDVVSNVLMKTTLIDYLRASSNCNEGFVTTKSKCTHTRESSSKRLVTTLQNKYKKVYGIFCKDTLLGFAVVLVVDTHIHVSELYIHQPFRCSGYGSSILTYLIEVVGEGKETRLNVMCRNKGAKKLYSKFGFISESITMVKPGVSK